MAIEPLPEQAVAGGRNGVSLASADDRNGSFTTEPTGLSGQSMSALI
jgi:hypothetical protein